MKSNINPKTKTTKKTPIHRLVNSSTETSGQKPLLKLSPSYSIFAVVVLALTVIIWSYFGAKLQSTNADQLVNSYLFEGAKTFHNAYLPSAHSFLIKWPLFLLIHILGLSSFAFLSLTMLLCVLTVGPLVYVLYRIDRRPVVFGTLCLSLASMLLLVPSEPYAGGILPVNMAMLATRNIEYIVYIAGLILLAKASRIRSWKFALAALFFVLLFASDKLFLTISAVGSGLALVGYVVVRRWLLVRLAARWLMASLLAAIGATALLWAVNRLGLTHISSPAHTSPYALVHSVKGFGLGVVFGILGIFTNFGANPAFDAAVLRQIPLIARTRLAGVGIISFLTNGVLFLIGCWLSIKVYLASFRRPKVGEAKTDSPTKLAVMMLFSSLASVIAFIATDHYYVVDARYLSILVFAMFICAAVYLRKKQLGSFRLSVAIGSLTTISVLVAVLTSYSIYKLQVQALANINQRNGLVAQAVANHPVDTLVGDYWRTIPIKAITPKIHVSPLENCLQNRTVLTSSDWELNLKSHSFAYLLSFDKSLTNFPACNLNEILAAYGRPNSTVVISGRVENPTEVLLFYDQGIHKNVTTNANLSILPLAPQQIPQPNCTHTVLNIVAHQDDDLLFLSPDLIHDIQLQHCVRTVYVTAGDAGHDKLYWLGRERGSEAAYSKLIQSDAPWVERTIKMSENQFVTLANPRGNSSISLIFMRLADGSPAGRGFMSSHLESLERLENSKISLLHTVDGQSAYTAADMVKVLTKLMQIYQPSEIHTQTPVNQNALFPDHSDHLAVGQFATKAYKAYDEAGTLPIKYYIGYPIKKMPDNINGPDLDIKTAAFLAYGQFDLATCQSKAQCDEESNYGSYLQRQYTAP